MKTYFKIIGVFAALFVIAMAVFLVFTRNTQAKSHEVSGETIALLHRLAKIAEEHPDDLTVLDNEKYEVAYVITDLSNHLLYAHADAALPEGELSVENAIQKRYPYLYLFDGAKAWGTIILLEDGTKAYQTLTLRLAVAVDIVGLLLLTGMTCYGLYVRRSIIIPFANLKGFAAKVAQGKLDEPLSMDKNNLFGAFSESFDIMREELAASKERELTLQKKERELVASLSHDLKTPVTGIKVTAELMQMRMSVKKNDSKDDVKFTPEELNMLSADAEGIRGKADQIATLLSDLFTTTLDDLGEFKVKCQDEDSRSLGDIVKGFDDRNLTVLGEIPAVIINIDKKCMSQVIGNIISNSYKYANTKIDVDFRISERFLEMQIRDHGPGVPSGELDLITNKFYRGKDWEKTDKDGHGLGLYIAKTLMQKMNGDLIAESDGDGLSITLVIPMS
ncbi:MAG: HAMP domain-containing histidine kinase [Acetatifactor sp.]|nr:HAMP domain-containing histidine kinase [Acetatifactor sp.]